MSHSGWWPFLIYLFWLWSSSFDQGFHCYQFKAFLGNQGYSPLFEHREAINKFRIKYTIFEVIKPQCQTYRIIWSTVFFRIPSYQFEYVQMVLWECLTIFRVPIWGHDCVQLQGRKKDNAAISVCCFSGLRRGSIVLGRLVFVQSMMNGTLVWYCTLTWG